MGKTIEILQETSNCIEKLKKTKAFTSNAAEGRPSAVLFGEIEDKLIEETDDEDEEADNNLFKRMHTSHSRVSRQNRFNRDNRRRNNNYRRGSHHQRGFIV